MSKNPPDQSMISLEALLDAAQASGLLINKLGQFDDGWLRAAGGRSSLPRPAALRRRSRQRS